MRIDVHMLSQRKKLIHFFLVRENIEYKLRIILEEKNLFNRHIKKLSELHRERETWHVGFFFYGDDCLSRDTDATRKHILRYSFSGTEFWENIFD